jgi:hypothetical protein
MHDRTIFGSYGESIFSFEKNWLYFEGRAKHDYLIDWRGKRGVREVWTVDKWTRLDHSMGMVNFSHTAGGKYDSSEKN